MFKYQVINIMFKRQIMLRNSAVKNVKNIVLDAKQNISLKNS